MFLILGIANLKHLLIHVHKCFDCIVDQPMDCSEREREREEREREREREEREREIANCV